MEGQFQPDEGISLFQNVAVKCSGVLAVGDPTIFINGEQLILYLKDFGPDYLEKYGSP